MVATIDREAVELATDAYADWDRQRVRAEWQGGSSEWAVSLETGRIVMEQQ